MRLLRLWPASLLLFTFARADIVTLTDGRTVEGEVVGESATEVTVKIPIGRTTIKREEIQSIEKRKSGESILRDKIAALSKSARKDEVAAWLEVDHEAMKIGAKDEMKTALTKVIELDPENATARAELGYTKVDGKWVNRSDLKDKAPEAAKVNPFQKDSTGAISKDTLAKMAGVQNQGLAPDGEKLAPCPHCNGTGIWVMLPCLNCNKSGKPGYKNLGDHYEIDQRCGGTGQVIGAYCDVCRHTGKVMLSHLNPADGGIKKAPAGYKWCPTCNGTGFESWLPCNQCKRSKWPGYNFFGDRLEMCQSCNGLGKHPALECSTCKKTGLVSLNAK